MIRGGTFINRIYLSKFPFVVSDKQPTQTGISLSSTMIAYGDTLTVTAQVTPSIASTSPLNGRAVFTFTGPGGLVDISNQPFTSAGGAASVAFTPRVAGVNAWQVSVFWTGNGTFAESTSSATIFSVNKSASGISLLNLGAAHILGQPLNVDGRLNLLNGNPGRVDLSGLTIHVDVTEPGASAAAASYPAQTAVDGSFHLQIPGAVLDRDGDWHIAARTGDTANIVGGNSSAFTVPVRSKRGYAILVRGAVAGNEGAGEHARTIQYVKNVLIAEGRGLFDDPQHPNGATDDIFEIDATMTDALAKLEQAVEAWARDKMCQAPAPLYLVLVNHGEADKFHLRPNQILPPDELSAMLNRLQECLNNPSGSGCAPACNPLARQEKIVVVLGMCFSGSFIDQISLDNRVIVSASAANERSIRGPGAADKRQGEYFVYLLFRELSNGASLFDSFSSARDFIRQVSSRFDLAGNAPGAPPFPGEKGQHPLLDDNGDGSGNFHVSKGAGDGQKAAEIYLISAANSTGTLNIARTNPTRFLTPSGPAPELFAEVDENPFATQPAVHSIFMEVKRPDAAATAGAATMQAELDLTRQPMDQDQTAIVDRFHYRWPGTAAGTQVGLFDAPGRYEVFFHALPSAESPPSEPAAVNVYRASGTHTPSAFAPLAPADGARVAFVYEGANPDDTAGIFRWEVSSSGAGDVHYLVRFWRDASRNALAMESEPLIPTHFVLRSYQLENDVTYWWDVVAVDAAGNSRVSGAPREVKVQNNNFPPGYIAGRVFDRATGAALTTATITIPRSQQLLVHGGGTPRWRCWAATRSARLWLVMTAFRRRWWSSPDRW